MERALLALCALLLNAVFAGPRRVYISLGLGRITRIPIHILRELERKLNRDHRSAGERQTRGLVVLLALVTVSILAGLVCERVFDHNLRFIEILVLVLALPVRQTFDIAWDIRKYLQAADLAGARRVLEGSVWRHHALLDEYGVARAAIETLAIHFVEKIMTPLLGYILFGLPGLLAVKTITSMQENLSKPVAGEVGFSTPADNMHRWCHYVSAQLAALLWAMTSFFIGTGKMAITRIKTVWGMSARPLTLYAMSAILDLSLGGPSSAYAQGVWYEHGGARAAALDVRRALMAYVVVNLLFFVSVGLFFG